MHCEPIINECLFHSIVFLDRGSYVFILVIPIFIPEAGNWRIRKPEVNSWMTDIQTRTLKQRGEPEQSE